MSCALRLLALCLRSKLYDGLCYTFIHPRFAERRASAACGPGWRRSGQNQTGNGCALLVLPAHRVYSRGNLAAMDHLPR